MRASLISMTACYLLFGSFSSFAQTALHPLTPAQKRAYHDCIYTAYVDDYCRHNYQGWWSAFEQQLEECTVANKGGKYPIGYRTWGPGIEDYCRAAVQGELH